MVTIFLCQLLFASGTYAYSSNLTACSHWVPFNTTLCSCFRDKFWCTRRGVVKTPAGPKCPRDLYDPNNTVMNYSLYTDGRLYEVNYDDGYLTCLILYMFKDVQKFAQLLFRQPSMVILFSKAATELNSYNPELEHLLVMAAYVNTTECIMLMDIVFHVANDTVILDETDYGIGNKYTTVTGFLCMLQFLKLFCASEKTLAFLKKELLDEVRSSMKYGFYRAFKILGELPKKLNSQLENPDTLNNIVLQYGDIHSTGLYSTWNMVDIAVPRKCGYAATFEFFRMMLIGIANKNIHNDSRMLPAANFLDAQYRANPFNGTRDIFNALDELILYYYVQTLRKDKVYLDLLFNETHPMVINDTKEKVIKVYLTLLIAGISNNILAMAFGLIGVRQSASCLYFIAISLADILCIVTNGVTRFLNLRYDIWYENSSNFACFIHVFSSRVSKTFSAWLMVGCTVDKMLVLLFPFKARQLVGGKKKITLKILFLLALAMLLNFYEFYIPTLTSFTMLPSMCWRKDVAFPSWTLSIWLSSLAYPLLPIGLNIIFTGIQCVVLYKTASRRKIMANQDSGASANETRIIKSLIVVAVLYILFTLPLFGFQIYRLYRPLTFSDLYIIDRKALALGYYDDVFNLLFLGNTCYNFIIYITCCGNLRKLFLDTICPTRLRKIKKTPFKPK